jgi:PBSX family phage terminase large subunit
MLIENFSEKQKEIVKFIKDKNQILICDGSVRSGKTVAMLFYFLIWSMAFYQNQKFAFCSNTIGSGERNLIDPLLSFENLPFDLNYNNSKHVLKVSVPRTTTNYFHLFGGDDAKSSFKIQGLTAQGILFDEVALMNKEFVNQAIARTMQNKNKKLWFNCNPEGPNH